MRQERVLAVWMAISLGLDRVRPEEKGQVAACLRRVAVQYQVGQ